MTTLNTYNADRSVVSPGSYTFPSHYPSRKAAFIDYLETVGGIDEATVDSLILEDDAQLLVELTCWVLDKLEIARNEFKNDQKNQKNDQISNQDINLQHSLYVNSQFKIGSRFQTQVAIERLGINYGAIPVNDKYFGPLLSLAVLDLNKAMPNRDVINFFHTLRSKNCWKTGDEFRQAYDQSPYIQYCQSVQQQTRNGIISPKHVPQSSPTMRIYELAFF